MKNGTLAKIGRNLLAIALFLALYKIAARTGGAIGIPEIESALEVAAAVLAVWLAFRLAAVVGVAFAGTLAVTLAVEFLYHAIFGYRTVQTGPVHMAVLTASLVGLLLGVFAAPRVAALRARAAVTPQQPIDRDDAQRSSLNPPALGTLMD